MITERRFIYTVYFLLFAWICVFTLKAFASIPWKDPVLRSKECQECLYKFASCMDFATKSADIKITQEIANHCVNKVNECGNENICAPVIIDEH